MTPEQRERLIERMRARGFAPDGDEQAGAVGSASSRTPPAAPRTASAPQRSRAIEPAAPAQGGATTFDALFGPLTPTESFGQVWLHQGGQLQRVRLRLGITDGQQTELIEAVEGSLREGAEVVTSVLIGGARPATPAPAGGAFPGLGGGRRGFGG
jgi:hypothetical protein